MGGRVWASGFRRPHTCFYTAWENRHGQSQVRLDAFGRVTQSQTSYITDSATAWQVSDSIRAELRLLGGRQLKCPRLYAVTEVWAVADHFATLVVDTTIRIPGTAVSVFAFPGPAPAQCT